MVAINPRIIKTGGKNNRDPYRFHRNIIIIKSITKRIIEVGISKKNAKRQIVAMTGVNKRITHPPKAKISPPNKAAGNNIETIKLNQKSAFILFPERYVSLGDDYIGWQFGIK